MSRSQVLRVPGSDCFCAAVNVVVLRGRAAVIMTPERSLHWRLEDAIRHNDLVALQAALAAGADANDRLGFPWGETVLYLAMAEGFVEGTRWLLANGADPALYYLPSGGPEFRSAFADAEDSIADPNETDAVKAAAQLIVQTGRRPVGPPPEPDPYPYRRPWWRFW